MALPSPDHLLHSECTGAIIGAFFEVYDNLGPRLSERVYGRALHAEFQRVGCDSKPECGMDIRYGVEKPVRFRPDFVVDGKVVVEIKARSHLRQGHWAQLINYLRVSEFEVGLLLNFGPRPQFKRLLLTKEWKH